MTYRKEYNEKGELINPITKSNPHISGASQRQAKRMRFKKIRFFGNNKGFSITATTTDAFFRRAQWILNKKTGEKRRILHYILK